MKINIAIISQLEMTPLLKARLDELAV